MALVPEGWFYAESYVGDPEEAPPTDIVVIGVCSKQCKEAFWSKGPGRLTSATKKETPLTGEK